MGIKKLFAEAFVALAMWAAGDTAKASIIVTIGAGSASANPTATATFNNLGTGASLTSVNENGINFSDLNGVNNVGFDPTNGNGALNGAFFIGPNPGGFLGVNDVPGALNIKFINNSNILDAQFSVGNNFGSKIDFVAVADDNGGTVIAVAAGGILNVADSKAFTFIKVGAYATQGDAAQALLSGFGTLAPNNAPNGLGVDNVYLQAPPASSTPEPGTFALLGLALAAAAMFGRARTAARSALTPRAGAKGASYVA